MDRLAKAVQWTFVSERDVVWLRLQPNFDSVEGVLDVFADDTG